ncbi:vanomycin resistance protein VanB [Actinoplanes philippinensis]|uniref:Vancomycin resistance protein YoaR, contains peptidoglycan-binding and VanW domains n=1 Tax=Actinoplanes philippinensis TaxID=35752 RepID=A0A1I2AY50_9ACTN|nr:VanW family protein [Actinoplanes philippinensis]GIE75587.1 vanomycin resistance protein VanB [Actinoplanes philippinensis]SFE48891.1 Vancomycin resistance protein YoaR, contains peptidoglycan-binding and VanW domains [Actinoplanes philippinensis]
MTAASDRQPTVRLPQQATPGHDDLGPPPAEAPAPPAAPRRGRRVLIAGLTAVALAAAAGGAARYALAGDVPRGVTVLGLDLGGLARAEAAAALRAHLAADPRATAAVQVRVEGRGATLKPADIGLVVDVDATVDAAARGGPSLFRERAVAPVIAVDAELLDAALRKAVGKVGTAMKAPAVTFTGLTPTAVHPRPGRGLDPRHSAEAVRAGWLTGAPVDVPLVELHAATTAEQVDRIVETIARPAVAAPLTVTSERGTLTIPPAAIAKSLVLTADRAGLIEPRFDPGKLRAAVAPALATIEVAARDATFTFTGGRPKIVAGAEGRGLDLAALAPQLLTAATGADGRTVAASLTAAAPATSAADLEKLGVKEKVSTFTTKFTGGLSSSRSQNIVTAAKQVRGALVLPGKTFSLNKHTGERGYRQGYKDAPVIVGGHLQPGVGGGVSQFTTTLFNASYYAGLEDVEHKPHSYYFDRYPAVIESTIFWPDLDFKFKNDSPYGVLIDTAWTSDSITVSMWSTKVWDKVTTEWSARRNITSPPTITKPDGPDCISTGGLIGFTQDAWRLFHSGGKVVKREKFTWKYDPEPRFVCGGPDAG